MHVIVCKRSNYELNIVNSAIAIDQVMHYKYINIFVKDNQTIELLPRLRPPNAFEQWKYICKFDLPMWLKRQTSNSVLRVLISRAHKIYKKSAGYPNCLKTPINRKWIFYWWINRKKTFDTKSNKYLFTLYKSNSRFENWVRWKVVRSVSD